MDLYDSEVQYFGTPKHRAKIILTVPLYNGKIPTKEMRIEWLSRLIRDKNEMIRSVKYWEEVLNEIKNY
jgi:hypothetical protein